MDQEIRNKLRNVVTQCRKLLEDSVSQELEGKYCIFAKKDQVTADPNATMAHLTEEERAARRDILDHFGHIKARGFKPKEALDQLVREIAFTHLNRLCAYKMMEAREVYVGGQKFREAVSRGVNSNGVKFYLADHPEEERLFNTGHRDIAYRHFLDWLGSLLSDEIGVLFNPNDPANRLYPRQTTLDEVLDLLNGGGIKADEIELRKAWPKIWSQDETIGWVYQYFTPKELRDQARKESVAPRNSYELAFRNQFFTPRYVVEFLSDNTLGRIWYDMRKGDTKLKDQCRYMVRRPTEVFMKDGEQLSKDVAQRKDGLSQEEMLKLPVHIAHRPTKDPRELKILDPACGSGHFLLYCFDLLLTIYEEAYTDFDVGPALQRDYPTLEDLRRDAPRLILAHNVHGIDIDLRCSQIAALALWLRCQRAYQERSLKKDRPKITHTNFVCAEPMPGEEQMLKEFVGQLEPKLLGQVVEVVFDKMKLAGEAGSLLKIEEESRDAVAAAKKQWLRETTRAVDRNGQPLLFTQTTMDRLSEKPEQQSRFDLADITDDHFFERAETNVIEALRSYAEKAQNGQKLQKQLFTDDAVRGFAFVDLCHRRYDVVLMNPPFGEGTSATLSYLSSVDTNSSLDLYAAFVDRGIGFLADGGQLGAITSRTGFFLPSFRQWREQTLLNSAHTTVFTDLGAGVLDSAMVETAAYCLSLDALPTVIFFRLLSSDCKEINLLQRVGRLRSAHPEPMTYTCNPTTFLNVPETPFCYWISPSVLSLFQRLPRFDEQAQTRRGLATLNDFRFVRLAVEVPNVEGSTTRHWVPYSKGESSNRFYEPVVNVVWWRDDGREVKQYVESKVGSASRTVQSESLYFRPGLTWVRRTHRLCVRFHCQGGIFSGGAQGIFVDTGDDDLLSFLGLLSSSIFDGLTKLGVGRTGDAVQFEPGMIARVPTPRLSDHKEAAAKLRKYAERAWTIQWNTDRTNELSPRFEKAAIAFMQGDTLKECCTQWQGEAHRGKDELLVLEKAINTVAAEMYGMAGDAAAISSLFPEDIDSENLTGSAEGDDISAEDVEANSSSTNSGVKSYISWCAGAAFGRFFVDVSRRDGCVAPPGPSDPLPSIAPALNWRAAQNGVFGGQPHNSTSGIIVDDAEHTDDIVRRIRDVLEVLWKRGADAFEKEASEILDVKEMRDYFRKPGKGGFWDDHVTRYTKSRRKAPIYWLLQSSKKSYALWLYYHRLDKDLLFKTLVNCVEPKIRLETSRLETIRSQKAAVGEGGKEAKRLAKETERQEDFLSELRDFEDKLRRAANLHLEPDLNDGVVLNIAPLWELVPWKEAKNYWDELLKGEYEWSSIGKQLRQKGLVK
jgi:hypothetical protein